MNQLSIWKWLSVGLIALTLMGVTEQPASGNRRQQRQLEQLAETGVCRRCRLAGVDLSGADLREVDLQGGESHGGEFARSQFRRGDFG